MELKTLIALQLLILIVILFLVWLQWYQGKFWNEVDTLLRREMIEKLTAINQSVANTEESISTIVTKMSDYADEIEHEWKWVNKWQVDPMLKRQDDISSAIGALEGSLDRINETLGTIKDYVDSISSHPAFTWPSDVG